MEGLLMHHDMSDSSWILYVDIIFYFLNILEAFHDACVFKESFMETSDWTSRERLSFMPTFQSLCPCRFSFLTPHDSVDDTLVLKFLVIGLLAMFRIPETAKMKTKSCSVCFGCGPLPVTMTTGIITF